MLDAQPVAQSFAPCCELAGTDASNTVHVAPRAKSKLSTVAGINATRTNSAAINDDADTTASFSRHLLDVIPALNNFARRLCKHVDVAEDLVQEALMKAWAARYTYQANTNFQAWMFTILRNHHFSTHRKRRWFVPWDSDVAERLLTCEPAQTGHVELAELASAMSKLPTEQQEALILVGAGGCTYEEAAQFANCAVGTIKSRVVRGRKALQAYQATQHKSGRDCPRTGNAASGWILSELQRLTPNSKYTSQTAFL